MSTSDAPAPATSDQVTATPPEAVQPTGSIPLPPMPEQPATPVTPAPPSHASEKFVRRLRVLDVILAVLVVAFAFEAACFRALNSDLFLHLAAGRAVAQGKLLGADPFSFTAETTWVNHAWLPDLVAYGLFRLDGESGVVLVILKALLVAALAAVMLRAASQPGRLLLIPALCVLLAILTLSPGLVLRPAVLSLLMLGVTLWLLERARSGDKLALWLLPGVCLLWVNLDAWFLLGPLTGGLYLLGEYLQTVAGEEKETPALPPKQLAFVLAVCVAVCVINPFHVRAFALPAPLQFGSAATVFASDDAFRSLSLAPWDEAYFDAKVGLSAAGMAYFVLLAAGIGSFAMTAPRWRWWRVLVWLAFAALSLLNVQAIPFFAVVAGPITALNFLDGITRHFGAEVKGDLNSRQLAAVERFLAIAAALALLVLGVPGLLQAAPQNQRELGVGVRTDEGLRDACRQVARWREDGVIARDARCFNTSPDAAAYLAYYSPGAKTFLDARLTPFDATAATEYRDARMALRGDLLPTEEDRKLRRPPPWRETFEKRQVEYVLFHVNDPLDHGAVPMVRRLYGNPREFMPAHVSGAASVFEWRDPNAKEPRPIPPALKIDFVPLAFNGEDKAPPEPREPPAPQWYDVLLPHGLADHTERDYAWQQRERFEAMMPVHAQRYRSDFVTFHASHGAYWVGMAGHVGYPRLGAAAALLGVLDTLNARYEPNLIRDFGPVESLYLAVRAARRSLVKAPGDAATHLVLAQAYANLRERTREFPLGTTADGRGGLFNQFRLLQVIVALNEALKCDPGPDLAREIHRLLAIAYFQQNFRDLQAKHLGEYLELLRTTRLPPTLTEERMKEAKKKLEEDVENAEKALRKLKDDLKTNVSVYNVNAEGKPVLGQKGRKGKVDYALENGLAETAMELFEKHAGEADVKGAHGGQQAVALALRMGRLKAVRDVLGETEDERGKTRRGMGVLQFGLPAYHWFMAQYAAATGDYKLANEVLTEAIEFAQARTEDPRKGWVWEGLKPLKDLPPEQQKRMQAAWQNLSRTQVHGGRSFADPQLAARVVLRDQHLSQLYALRAWLALEAGEVESARQDAWTSLKYSLVLEQAQESRNLAGLVVDLTNKGKGK